MTIANEYVLYRKYDKSNPPLFYCKICSYVTARPMELCHHIVKCKINTRKSKNSRNSRNSKFRFSKSSRNSRNDIVNDKIFETNAIIQNVLNRIEENN